MGWNMTTTEWTPNLTREQMEQRRMKAAELFEDGFNPNQVAKKLDVNRSSSCRWFHRWKEGGKKSLQIKKAPGSRIKLNDEQKEKLEGILLRGASTYEYDTDLWTLKRISHVIEKEFSISYHPSSLSRSLKILGYSCQKPIRVATNRDEVKRLHWVKTVWEEDKKK